MTFLRRLGRDDRGFTMFTVMMVMLVAGLFVVSAYAAAGGDVPLGGQSRDSRRAYAAAEAGIEYYASHIAADPDYWTKCTTVPKPNPNEPNPVANEWYGPTTGADTRTGHWRKVPGSTATYSIELLAAKDPDALHPTPQCVAADQTSMLDPSTGVFRIRSTGRAGTKSRSIVASFRRPSFLDFLWFTNFENLDPVVATSDQAWQASHCVAFRPARNAAKVGGHSCSEITFPASDQIKGPFHSNDSVQFSNGTKVGRPGKNDNLETHQPAPGYSGSPTFYPAGSWAAGQDKLDIPTSNGDLKPIAVAGGKVFTGKTSFVVTGNKVDVTKSDNTTTSFNISDTNGVIYVQNATASACSTVKSPQIADYGEQPGCGNAYVSGTYSSSFTLTSDADIVVGTPTSSADLRRSSTSDAVAGLIATNFVRVQHRVTRTAAQAGDPENCTNVEQPPRGNVYIDAAMLSVGHSFIVDNFACGAPLGTLHVTGALAQNFRGRVAGSPLGTGVDSGFVKDYNYDDRLKFRSPPYFLAPLISAWHIVRRNEQVPAR
jgi:Tfp pilus assembly protein PilX